MSALTTKIIRSIGSAQFKSTFDNDICLLQLTDCNFQIVKFFILGWNKCISANVRINKS